MKKLLPIITSLVLLVVLLVFTMLSDRMIGKTRLEQVASIPDYAPIITDIPMVTAPDAPEKDGDEAPNITLTDQQGNTVTLEEFQGKTVVINFWASWCGPSYRELGMIQQAYEEYQDEVHFLIVNTTSDSRETKEAADQFIADGGFTFPVYYDLDASAATEYSVISLPTTFFIDANGKAIAYANGEINRANLDLGLQLCRDSVEKAGGIHMPATTPTDSTDPMDDTFPTEDTLPAEETAPTEED